MYLRVILSVLTFAVVATALHADNWPQWRGPAGDGTCKEKSLPSKWSATENILWSVPLPGMGGATPVVWGDKLFLTSEAKDGSLALLCFNTKDGKELWSSSISPKKSRKARVDEGNAASASPSTDGKYVYAFVGTGEFACFDFEGKEIWKFDAQERYGKFNIQFGISSTPVLFQGKLYWQLMHTDGQYVICIDTKDGKDVWKVERPSDGRPRSENPHSYASAQLWQKGDSAYIVAHGFDYTTAHDLKDGREIWRLMGLNPKEKYHPTLRFVSSPLVTPDLIVIPTAKGGQTVAIKPNAQGGIDPGSPYEQWRRLRDTPDVPCPLLVDGLVYLCSEGGVLLCIDAETGKELYKQRMHSARYRSSPVYGDGKIYCTARDGTITVVKPGKVFETISVNKLDDQIAASPIIADGKIFLRGFEKLYCIGTK